MKVFAFGTAVMTAVILAAGCSSSEPTNSISMKVQGGSVDTTDDFAVGVCAGNGPGQCQLICSGALIAPNLVMTARHCVDQTSSKTIDCTSTTFGSPYGSASNYYITTNYLMNQGSIGWHQASQIITTPGANALVCGNDIALLILSTNVSLTE